MTEALRVAHVVVSDSFAGVERYVADVAAELARRAWPTYVIGGDSERMAHELGGAARWLPGRTVAQAARSLWAVGPVDLVHLHMTAAELVGAALKPRSNGRLVATRHFAASRGKTRLGRLARPLISRSLDGQVAISRFVADRIDGASTVIHNGVRQSGGEAAQRERTVVVLQRLEAEKDTSTALHAWARSGLRADGWRLVICGRGAEAPALREAARTLGITDSVEFRGFVEQPREVLAEAGIMLATAAAEPFGLAVVEAMSEGTPVVAADGGAHRETLGPAGRYFAPGDAATCAALLDELGTSAELRASIGSQLRARQELEFSVDRHVDRLIEWYQAVLHADKP